MHGMCRATHFRMNKNQEDDEFIAVRVQDPRIQNEGSWSSYVDFKIFLHTNSKAFTAKTSCVRRRYSEFVWLKKKLQKNSGLVPVPDLPGKTLFFSFNEDLIERRRRGLQNFLDKVVHMTVCLSDSQLHLFLQTQLPVGHIEDCVHGLTPYTVTDAILTYASSNRGWAQEEEGVVQEPGLPSVSYESVDSPAPHLPSLQTEETYEFRASEAETRGEDLLETSHEGKHFNEKDVLKVDVHEINSCMIMGTEASVEEKCINEQGVQNIDVHKTNSNAIRETEASMEEKCINERSVLKAVTLECKTCVSEAIEAGIEERDTSEEHSFEVVIRETEASIEEKCINEQGVLEVVTLECKTCVSEAIEAGIEEQDTSEEHSLEGVIRETEASIEEKCINEQGVLEVVTLEHKTCVSEAIEAGIEEKDTYEEHSFEEDAEETKICVAGAMKGAGEEPVHEACAHDNNPVPDTRPYLQDSDTCILKVTPAQGKEGPLKEENFSEEDVCEEDIQDINIHKFEEMLGTIQENEASEDPVCQAYTHLHKSKPDTQDVDTFKVTAAHAYEENLCEEVVHKEDVQEINMHEFEEMLGTIQENEASEEPVHQTHTHVHKSRPGSQDLDTSTVTAAHAYEEDVNEYVCESSNHEVNVCLIGGAETNCTEKCPNGLNSHETCSCVIGGEENPLEEKIGDDVHKVIAHVSNVSVTGETGDDVTKMDSNDKDVYKTAVNGSNISMTGAKEIAVKVDTTETADEICSSWANCHDSESSSDSKSDIQDTDIIITPSDTLEGDTGEVVHTTNADNTSTGTTDVDICEDDCIVLGNSDDIQEKASCGTKEDKADPKYF